MDLLGFFTFLYGELPAPGQDPHLTIWCRQTKQSTHFAFPSLGNAVKQAEIIDVLGQDAYFGVGLRRPGLTPLARGQKSTVVALPGLWLDIDLLPPPGVENPHAATDLPADIGAAMDLLQRTCSYDPTMVVSSGFGLHCYWLFERPLVVAPDQASRLNLAWKNFQKRIVDAARVEGIHVDQTGNIDRVLRCPGTRNHKVPGAPRPVEVLDADGPRYNSDTFFSTPRPRPVAATVAAPVGTPASSTTPPEALVAVVRQSLTRLRNNESRELAALVLAGKSFAQPGERDHALQRIASIIAFVAPPGSPAEVLAVILAPSLAAMADEADDEDNPAPTMEDAVEKIERAQLDAVARDEKDARLKAALGIGQPPENSRPPGVEGPADRPGSVGPEAPGTASSSPETGEGGGDDGDGGDNGEGGVGDEDEKIVRYTEEDLARFAASQKVSTSGFRRRWIIQSGTGYYVFVNGRYQFPVVKDSLLTRLRDDLAPASELGISLWTLSSKGTNRKMTVQEIMDAYGTAARETKGSLVINESFYDAASDTFREAVCSRRPLTPAFNQKIQDWLLLLGASNPKKFIRWIAAITRLGEQNSALYMSGIPASGKTMLAHGLARIWTTGGPTDLGDVVSTSFNSGIARCPLVFGDEDMGCTTKELRRFVGSSSHTLRRKYLPNVELEGSVRIILADNGAKMLVRDEDLSAADVDAVATKFLHIRVGKGPAEYLKQLGGRKGTDGWVDGDMIAAHALWLVENTEVTSDGRFAVEGEEGAMARSLSTQGKVPSLVCEWIAGYLEKPIPNLVQQKLLIVGGGRVLINVDAIYTLWDHFIKSEHKVFSRTRIGTALGNMSYGMKRVGTRRYHNVKPDLIYDWVESNLVGDLDVIRDRVNAPLSAEQQAELALVP